MENFLRQVRRRLPTSKEYKAPSHETGTARLTPHGRNDNGTCFPTTKRSRRTRQWGGGGPGRTKCEELDEELFAWFVDSIQNVKGRIPSFLLLDAAQTFAEDSVIRTVVDWDQIVPSYLAARRLAGPSSRGWAQAWCQREHPPSAGGQDSGGELPAAGSAAPADVQGV